MAFRQVERAILLGVKGVGPKVVERLEQAGFDSLAALAGADAHALCAEISARLGASCWRNSPLARAALDRAIAAARAHQDHAT